jgi:uncharacterized protein (DUF58 family)
MTRDSRKFLDPEVLARLSRLELRARYIVEGFISGTHRSPFYGYSVEFAQHREYAPGDDLRHLDWKVWARADRFYVKEYEEETNQRAVILLDVSESMHYGAGPLNKYEYACCVGASLAFLLFRQQDSVGLMTFDEDIRDHLPPRSHPEHMGGLLKLMEVGETSRKTDMERILRRFAEAYQRREMLILVTDLLAPREGLFRGLDLVRYRSHDILILHVMDDEELDFPFAGTTRFEGLEAMGELTCDPRALREDYLAALGRFLAQVRRHCVRNGIDYQLVRTRDHLDAALSAFLSRRLATARKGSHH